MVRPGWSGSGRHWLKPLGSTFLQLVVHLPVVLFLLWFLAKTLTYLPPVVPG